MEKHEELIEALNTDMQTEDFSQEDLNRMLKALHEGATIACVCNMSDDVLEGLYSVAYNLYSTGNYKDAEVLFRALSLYNHNDARFWMGLAGCRQAVGDLQGAVDAYSMAGVASALSDPQPFLFGALCFVKMGKKQDAVTVLRGIMVLGDENNAAHMACREKAKHILQLLEAA